MFVKENSDRKKNWLLNAANYCYKAFLIRYLRGPPPMFEFYVDISNTKPSRHLLAQIIILISDFNVEISDSHMDSACAIYHHKSLIKDPAC